MTRKQRQSQYMERRRGVRSNLTLYAHKNRRQGQSSFIYSESAGKPGSVVDNHSSGTCVATGLKQPTRIQCEQHRWIPIWPCSKWGLPCHGVLPPMRCALTAPFHPYRFYVPQAAHCTSRVRKKRRYLSVALSVGSRLPGVTWHLALWSPDFPP